MAYNRRVKRTTAWILRYMQQRRNGWQIVVKYTRICCFFRFHFSQNRHLHWDWIADKSQKPAVVWSWRRHDRNAKYFTKHLIQVNTHAIYQVWLLLSACVCMFDVKIDRKHDRFIHLCIEFSIRSNQRIFNYFFHMSSTE